MKWFQHYSDGHNDLKLRQVIKKYGMEGYGLYWLCVELVANQGHNLSIKSNEGWEDVLELNSRLKVEMIREMTQFFSEMNLISKSSLSKGILAIPKLAKYSDDYSRKRVRTHSVQSSDKVPLDKNRIDKNRIDNTFEQFWSSYPKKVAKKKAEQAFKKISHSEHEPILKTLAVFRASPQWTKDNGQFIPHAATWLNQERWKDEIQSVAAPPVKPRCKSCGKESSSWINDGGTLLCMDCAGKPKTQNYQNLKSHSETFKSMPNIKIQNHE